MVTNCLAILVCSLQPERNQFKYDMVIAALAVCGAHPITAIVGNLETACDVLLDAGVDAGEKEYWYDGLKNSFYCNPPIVPFLPANFADRIELTFYLRLILNSDTLVSTPMLGSIKMKPKRTAINVAPGSQNYPKQNAFRRSNEISGVSERVEYARIGQTYIDQMNSAYKKSFPGKFGRLIDSDWFGERSSAPMLDKAYKVLQQIARDNNILVNKMATPASQRKFA